MGSLILFQNEWERTSYSYLFTLEYFEPFEEMSTMRLLASISLFFDFFVLR